MNSWEFYSRIEMFKHTQKDDELAHYGITGQKWGQRRWQYADGRFNPEGKERYFGTGKNKKEKSSDTGVKDYIKYKNDNNDQKQKFGGHTENSDISDRANEIYKKYKPSEWNRVLNESNLSYEDRYKTIKELNNKLYKEDKHYAKIVNDKNVKNALQEYIDSWNDVIKESNRIYSKEFMDNNPEAKNWDGDGTEYWHKFADKDISNRDNETYWKLRETISSLSYKHGKWNNEILDKALSDLTGPVENTEDDSNKAYDKIKENIGIDFRKDNQKFGSTDKPAKDFGSSENPFERKTDKDYIDKNGNFDDAKYDADKQRAIKELDTKYDKDFANVMKDNYDTTGEWGDVDAEYAKFKENPYDYLRKYSRDPKYNISDKEEKKAAKEMKKTVKSLNKKDIDIDDSNVKDINKFNKTVKNLNDDYEKHNEIIIDKLVNRYYNAYKNTYGYEENPLSKAEFKKTFENIRGTLHSDGILEGYTESDVNNSFSDGYYFNYDVLNKIVSDIEAD